MKIYYVNRYTNQIFQEEPETWYESDQCDKIIELDSEEIKKGADLSGEGHSWSVARFVSPNKLVFTYNSDWIEN